MTFGEKLKKARIDAGLSQEQLAEQISVSRSAVAKWETDKGLPDIENLKGISRLLNVSIDSLLSDDEAFSLQTTRTAIDLDALRVVPPCRSKKDAAVLAAYPGADAVIPLIRKKKLSGVEHLLEWTIMPSFGLFEAVDQLNNTDGYYLVEDSGSQFLVRVDREFLTASRLARRITEKKFSIGNDRFQQAAYRLK